MRSCSVALLLCLSLSLNSQVRYDTVSSRQVGPGSIHTKLIVKQYPWVYNVLEVDLRNPFIRIESSNSHDRINSGLERTSSMAKRNDAPGHYVIGAVNADFFSFETGDPVHNQICKGEIVQQVSSSRPVFASTDKNGIKFGSMSMSMKVFAKGSNSTVSTINKTRTDNTLAFFNSYFGNSTATATIGTEVVIHPVTEWTTNDTVKCIVDAVSSSANSTIPKGSAVLSGNGTGATFLATNCSVGDTISVYSKVFNTPGRIKELLGGNPMLVQADTAVALTTSDAFNTTRNPRTYVAINKDTTKLYLVVIDGRQTSSLGHTLFEAQTFFINYLHASYALNFDGGGSTGMVVRGAVVNSPSDPGGERSVANALMVIAATPAGEVTSLNILEDKADVFQGNSYQFHAEGKDDNFNPIALPSGIVWSVDSAIGTIDNTGLFTAKSTNDSGWVRIRYNSAVDSSRVIVRLINELHVFPRVLVMVPGEQVKLVVRGRDSEGRNSILRNDQVQFLSSTPTLNVSTAGLATATGFGSGLLTVMLDTVKCIVPYSSSGLDTTVVIEPFKTMFGWSWLLDNADADDFAFGLSSDTIIVAPPAAKLDYKFTPNANPSYVNLNTDIPISSRVDSFYIRVYGDGGNHQLRLYVKDKDGEAFSIVSTAVLNWRNSWKSVSFRTVFAQSVAGGTLDYPITITQVQVVLGSGNLSGSTASGSLYFDDLTAHYPNRTVTPQVLFDFNSGVSGWLAPWGVGSGQTAGVSKVGTKLEYSTEHPYEGTGCGKWTFIDSVGFSTNWTIRIARSGTTTELGSMLRGSYIGAWVWANGETNLTMRTVIRDGNSQICQGPPFPVKHIGWKLIGTKLDASLFTVYLTAGTITDINNKFNGFRVEAPNAAVEGQTRVLYIDKMVTSALTVPSGFTAFTATWNAPNTELRWSVNSEISISRYVVERGKGGIWVEAGSVAGKGNADTTQMYEFFDTPPLNNSYDYRIRQWTNDGGQEVSPIIAVSTSTTGLNDDPSVPLTFALEQNYPNPFNPSTVIDFQLPEKQLVTLKVFDMLGREVAALLKEERSAGKHRITFNAATMASGVYFYAIEAGQHRDTKKMILLR